MPKSKTTEVKTPKSQMHKHESLAAFVKERTGHNADPQTIAYAFGLTREWRASKQYKDMLKERAASALAEKELAASMRKSKEKATKIPTPVKKTVAKKVSKAPAKKVVAKSTTKAPAKKVAKKVKSTNEKLNSTVEDSSSDEESPFG